MVSFVLKINKYLYFFLCFLPPPVDVDVAATANNGDRVDGSDERRKKTRRIFYFNGRI